MVLQELRPQHTKPEKLEERLCAEDTQKVLPVHRVT